MLGTFRRHAIVWAVASSAALFGLSPAAEASGYQPPVAAGPQVVKYPFDAQRNGEEGTVAIKVLVTSSGKIHTAQLVRSSGSDRLDNAALESVLAWHFKPAVENGSPVSGWATVQVVYKVPAAGQQ